ncbi:MAG: Mini-ribonuclease 3 [Clostridiales bacterium]|nr:Mini-ribonuclease 3 [Clostridiales bacterium]
MSSEQKLEYIHPSVLAFLGDAAYELHVRRAMIDTGEFHSDMLHRKAVHFVRAESQAIAIKALLPELSEEEQALVKRARNKKVSSQPRHADPVSYKWATAFEALLGYWVLKGEDEKVKEVSLRAMEIIRKSRVPERCPQKGEPAPQKEDSHE